MKIKVGDKLTDECGDIVEVVGITNDDRWKYVVKRLSDGYHDCKKEKHLDYISDIDE